MEGGVGAEVIEVGIAKFILLDAGIEIIRVRRLSSIIIRILTP
jgi:hypothetical protein